MRQIINNKDFMETKEADYNKSGCEIELGNEKLKIFLKVFFDPVEIWIDTMGLPKVAFLCAMHDGTDCISSICGEEGEEQERWFLPIEWVINGWGGDEQIVNAIKKRKELILNDLENLKEKYVR